MERVVHLAVERFRVWVESTQDATLFTARAFASMVRPPFYARETLEQIHFAGIGSLFIVEISAIVAGQALGLQMVRDLALTGTKTELGHFMVISVVRALGPVLTGMVVASRMAAGITALGSALTETSSCFASWSVCFQPMTFHPVFRGSFLMEIRDGSGMKL